MPVAPIVPLIFVEQIPGAQNHEEHHHIGQQRHDDVEGNDAADGVADEFGDLVFVVYPFNSFEKEPGTVKDAWLWLTAPPASDGHVLDLAQLGSDGVDFLVRAALLFSASFAVSIIRSGRGWLP